MAVGIRTRVDDDLEECVGLLELVHRADGYPTYWPDDPALWLSPSGLIGAWVADDQGVIVGHIALCAGTADPSAVVWSNATGLDPGQFASISRLFVSCDRRGAGMGRLLFDTACVEAVECGLQPALDVVETNRDAIRLYEHRGWRRVRSEPWSADRRGETLLHYYVAPS